MSNKRLNARQQAYRQILKKSRQVFFKIHWFDSCWWRKVFKKAIICSHRCI